MGKPLSIIPVTQRVDAQAGAGRELVAQGPGVAINHGVCGGLLHCGVDRGGRHLRNQATQYCRQKYNRQTLHGGLKGCTRFRAPDQRL